MVVVVLLLSILRSRKGEQQAKRTKARGASVTATRWPKNAPHTQRSAHYCCEYICVFSRKRLPGSLHPQSTKLNTRSAPHCPRCNDQVGCVLPVHHVDHPPDPDGEVHDGGYGRQEDVTLDSAVELPHLQQNCARRGGAVGVRANSRFGRGATAARGIKSRDEDVRLYLDERKIGPSTRRAT